MKSAVIRLNTFEIAAIHACIDPNKYEPGVVRKLNRKLERAQFTINYLEQRRQRREKRNGIHV